MTHIPALACAQAVLDGRHRIPGAHVPRAAACLVRQALENAVDGLCGPGLTRARMRSRLIVLRHGHGDQIGDIASTAWFGLSHACHHHAYELTPTSGEVQYLLDQVGEVIRYAVGSP